MDVFERGGGVETAAGFDFLELAEKFHHLDVYFDVLFLEL